MASISKVTAVFLLSLAVLSCLVPRTAAEDEEGRSNRVRRYLHGSGLTRNDMAPNPSRGFSLNAPSGGVNFRHGNDRSRRRHRNRRRRS